MVSIDKICNCFKFKVFVCSLVLHGWAFMDGSIMYKEMKTRPGLKREMTARLWMATWQRPTRSMT